MTDQELFDKLVRAANKAHIERIWLELGLLPYPPEWAQENAKGRMN